MMYIMKLCCGFHGSLIVMMLANMLLFNPCAWTSTIDPRLVNFLRLLCSDYSDIQQLSEDVQNHESQVHALALGSYTPVRVPGFNTSLTVLFKQSLENKLHRLIVFTVTVDTDDVIIMTPFNVPHMDEYTYESPVEEIIARVKEGDLRENSLPCEVRFSIIESNVFFGSFPDCLDYSSTNLESYIVLLTCSAYSFFTPSKAHESSNPRPYRANVIGDRISLSPFSDIIGDISSIKDPCTCF